MRSMKAINFDIQSVRGIFNNKKTQMRIVMKPQPIPVGSGLSFKNGYIASGDYQRHELVFRYSKLKIGEIIYVKEPWAEATPTTKVFIDTGAYVYKETLWEQNMPWNWRSSASMPLYAARLFLRIQYISVERLNAISESDIFAEGIIKPAGYAKEQFIHLQDVFARMWDKSHYGRLGCQWGDNPLVWVYGIKSHELTPDEMQQTKKDKYNYLLSRRR